MEMVKTDLEKEIQVASEEDAEAEEAYLEYRGAAGGSGGAIGMMEMVKTDLEKEIQVASEEDAEAEDAYIKDRNNMQETLEAQNEAKDQAERELAELEEKITALEADKSDLNDDLDAQNDIKVALEKDCG